MNKATIFPVRAPMPATIVRTMTPMISINMVNTGEVLPDAVAVPLVLTVGGVGVLKTEALHPVAMVRYHYAG
jgi:hypothetical protein